MRVLLLLLLSAYIVSATKVEWVSPDKTVQDDGTTKDGPPDYFDGGKAELV